MINGSEDEPKSLLFITRDAQHFHGCLQLRELLCRSLLVLSLGTNTSNFSLQISPSAFTLLFPVGIEDIFMSEKLIISVTPRDITLDCGAIPKALFSAMWLKCSSVL